jgi:hypothetical protein
MPDNRRPLGVQAHIGAGRRPRSSYSPAFPGVALALFTVLPGSEAFNQLAQGHLATAGKAGGLACFAGAALARFVYDFLPRKGWLVGGTLIVASPWGERRCDLAAAEVVKLGSTMPPLAPGLSPVPVLSARQRPGVRSVRLLLCGPGLTPMSPEDLRLLADAIGQRPKPDRRVQDVIRRLRAMADQTETDARPPVVDWSHRTGPPGERQVGSDLVHPPNAVVATLATRRLLTAERTSPCRRPRS